MRDIIIPDRRRPDSDDGYFEQMTKAIFQAGFRWQVVENKWPDFREAFAGFSIDAVASFTDRDVERLLSDPGIVRNGRKIEATLGNARVFQDLQAEHGSFHAYLRTLDGRGYRQISKELQNRFHHLGNTGAYVFLWCVDEEVPRWEER